MSLCDFKLWFCRTVVSFSLANLRSVLRSGELVKVVMKRKYFCKNCLSTHVAPTGRKCPFPTVDGAEGQINSTITDINTSLVQVDVHASKDGASTKAVLSNSSSKGKTMVVKSKVSPEKVGGKNRQPDPHEIQSVLSGSDVESDNVEEDEITRDEEYETGGSGSNVVISSSWHTSPQTKKPVVQQSSGDVKSNKGSKTATNLPSKCKSKKLVSTKSHRHPDRIDHMMAMLNKVTEHMYEQDKRIAACELSRISRKMFLQLKKMR